MREADAAGGGQGRDFGEDERSWRCRRQGRKGNAPPPSFCSVKSAAVPDLCGIAECRNKKGNISGDSL